MFIAREFSRLREPVPSRKPGRSADSRYEAPPRDLDHAAALADLDLELHGLALGIPEGAA